MAHGIEKISGVLTEIGKFDIILIYDVSIARLIPIIKLTLVYYEKRERKKQVLLQNIIRWRTKKFFFFQIGKFMSGIGEKTYFLALGMGPNFGSKIG